MKHLPIILSLVILLFAPIHVSAASGNTLIFSSNRSGNYEIYRKNLATGVVANLTNNPADDMNPQISPDKSTMAFYSNRSGNNQIYKLSLAQPSQVTRLTTNAASDYDPDFLPNGNIIFKSTRSDGYGDIWIMTNAGAFQKNLTPTRSTTEEWKPIALSNTLFMFTSRPAGTGTNSDEVYTLNRSTGQVLRITNNSLPDWYTTANPTKTLIAFTSDATAGASDAIFKMNPNGTSRTRVSPTTLLGDSDDPSFSPDGQRIVFVNNKLGHYRVCIMNLDGTGLSEIDPSPVGNSLSPILVSL